MGCTFRDGSDRARGDLRRDGTGNQRPHVPSCSSRCTRRIRLVHTVARTLSMPASGAALPSRRRPRGCGQRRRPGTEPGDVRGCLVPRRARPGRHSRGPHHPGDGLRHHDRERRTHEAAHRGARLRISRSGLERLPRPLHSLPGQPALERSTGTRVLCTRPIDRSLAAVELVGLTGGVAADAGVRHPAPPCKGKLAVCRRGLYAPSGWAERAGETRILVRLQQKASLEQMPGASVQDRPIA